MKTYTVPKSVWQEAKRLIEEVSDEAAYEFMANYSDEMAIMCGGFSNSQIKEDKIVFHDFGNEVNNVVYDGTFAIKPRT